MAKTPWYKKEINILPVSVVDIVTMTKNLAVMLSAGMTVPETLDVMVEQSTGRLKTELAKVNKKVQAGELFGDALEEAHGVFNAIFISSVKIGENSGTLTENLNHVAEQMEQDLEVRRNVQGAMLYPGIVISATLILGLALATFVLPQMATIFSSLNVELPWTTRVVMWVAAMFQQYGALITPAILIGLILLIYFLRRRFMQPFTHRVLLLLPAIGGFIHDINRARFCRSLGTMLQTGVPIQESLRISKDVMPNYLYRQSIRTMYEHIESGESFAEIIAQFPSLYPKMVHRMIAVGERSGSLGDSLLYLARFYEQRVAIKAKSISTIIEPMLLIFIGLGVGFIALSIFTPIYSVTEGVTF